MSANNKDNPGGYGSITSGLDGGGHTASMYHALATDSIPNKESPYVGYASSRHNLNVDQPNASPYALKNFDASDYYRHERNDLKNEYHAYNQGEWPNK